MVCIRNNLKVHTQELKFGSNDKFRESFPVFRSGFKISKEESEIEDGEFAITLKKEESLHHDNCTWLSIGGAPSPSSCSQYDGLFGYMDLKIDAWFISLLSTQSPKSDTLLNETITFFDGSRVNPMEEASLVLDQRKNLDENVVFQENLEEEEEEVVSWLKNESFDGDPEWSHCQTLDKESTSKLAYFTDSSDEHSLFSSSSSSDYSSEIMDLEEIGTDKPLFWPFNSASDWSSDTKWDFFIMSPCKDIYKVGNSPKTSHNLNLKVPNGEPNSEIGCNRRLMFGTHLKSSDIFDLKNKNGMNDKRSRLKRCNKTSTNTEADLGVLTEAHFVDSEDTRTKTPVFWPSNCATEWGFDAKWDILTISPRKDVYKIGKSLKISSKTDGNMDLEKGCNRRLEFSIDSKSSRNMTKARIK